MTDVTVAILAGGQSSRMGTDKAFVTIAGRTVIEHMLDRLSHLPGVAETILIANRPADYAHLKLPIFSDLIPGKGALGGIYTAIACSQSRDTLVLACDMPLVNPDLLALMIAQQARGPFDVVVPRVDGYPQGLHALYGKKCLAPIKEDLETDRLKVIGFYKDVHVCYLDEDDYALDDPGGRSFINVNTPDDLARVRELLARE